MKKFFGAMILAAGILIAGLSGLCTLVFLISALFDNGSDFMTYFPGFLIASAIPIAIGVGLIFGGRALIRLGYEDDKRGM